MQRLGVRYVSLSMAPRGAITVAAALVCLVLGLLCAAPAASSPSRSKTCCTTYNRKPVPFQRIKGYREQTITENCRIQAIIFYTSKKIEICATRRDEWVRKTLELLSSKLKKMSKTTLTARQPLKKKPVKPSFNDEDGAFFTTTESFLNDTETFY